MTDTTNPPAVELLRRAEAYLSALHGSVARHDNLAANYGCAGCELRDQIRAAASAPEPETTGPTAVLSEAEQTMLAYALDQAQERIWSEGGFAEEDQAAVDSLRRRAVLPAPADQTAAPTAWAYEQVSTALDADRQQAEVRRLALAAALRLDTGAPWDAIRDRAAELAAPTNRAAILREAADWFDRYDVDSARELRRLADEAPQPQPAPPVDRCIHVKAIHDTHHHTPVTGCPWCTAAAATGTEA
jgi:hypothetical protein